MAKFDLYRDVAGDYRWRFRANDGRVIAVSSQAYLHPPECKSDVELLKAQASEAVVDVLVKKLMTARERSGVDSMVIAGGVACNNVLRERLKGIASENGIGLFHPRSEYCTDNGAMIAVAGYHRIINGEQADLSIDARSRFPIQDLAFITPKDEKEFEQQR